MLTPANEIHLSDGVKQAIGGAMLVAGALGFGAATRRRREDEARLEFPHATLPRFTSTNAVSSRWLIWAIALSIGAATAFALGGESPGVVFAWLASVAALFLSQVLDAPLQPPRIAREPWPYLAALGALLVVALLTRAWIRGGSMPAMARRNTERVQPRRSFCCGGIARQNSASRRSQKG